MSSDTIGAFSPADARMILDAVRVLKAKGALQQDGKKLPSLITPPRLIYFKNAADETCPPYAIMQVTGTEEIGGQNYLITDKYSEANFGQLLINSNREVPAEEYGIAQPGPVYRIQGDGNAVTAGHLWGPENDAWTVTDNGGPYLVSGEDDVEEDVIVATLDIATTHIATVTSQISAASGDVLGNGQVTLRPIGASWTASGQQVGIAVGSILSDTSEVNAKVIVARNTNGRLVVIAEDCGDG